MTYCLVSLCNLTEPAGSGLLCVSLDRRDEPKLVPIGTNGADVRSCTGLTTHGGLVYCLWIGLDFRSYLSVLDADTLAVVEMTPLDGVLDAHSLTAAGGWLYIVSTAHDQVKRVELARVSMAAETVWRASSADRDTHHLNSIASIDGRLLATAFGPKAGERWSTALEGYVVDLESGEVQWSGIEHPHSLTRGPDDVYVAESRRARVCGLTTGRSIPVEGYARGLAFAADGRLIIGLSRGRSRSRSLGTIENAADPGEAAGDTGLCVVASGPATRGASPPPIDLRAFGPEVYDVVCLPAQFSPRRWRD